MTEYPQIIKILKIVSIAAAVPVAFVLIVFIVAISKLQNVSDLQNLKNASASVVLSHDGDLIGKIYTENRTNILYSEIPVHLINALVATEDVRFFTHKGIDSRSMLRVFFKTILLNRKSSGGGSTITQQLAKNLYGRKRRGPFAIFVIKTREALLAHRMERVYTKDEILTLYLNTVPFGENIYGIEVAAQRYFNKKIEDLSIEESAVLVGMLKANNIYNPRLFPENAIKRRNVVLQQMEKYGYLQKTESDSLSRLPLVLNYSNIETAGPGDYFIYQVKKEVTRILESLNTSEKRKWNIEEDGLIITTTLNLDLQNYINLSFKEHLSAMQEKLDEQFKKGSQKRFLDDLTNNELKRQNLMQKAEQVGTRMVFDWTGSFADTITVFDSVNQNLKLLHAGLIAMDPNTGAIRAWAGGIDFKTQPFDQVLAQRQMGSTFKPILYAAAMEDGIKPCFYLDNDSVSLPGYEDWIPENFDRKYGGKYSLTGALVHSMNIPTLNLFLKLGFAKLNSLWKKMGFSFEMVNSPSLAMGTAEASVLELAVAYSCFSNGGYSIMPHSILSIKSADGEIIWENENAHEKQRILSERTAQLISEILQKAVNQGTGNPLRSVYGVNIPVAGKTGTSQDYSDAWFAAFNPSLVMISRVGASLPVVRFQSSANGTGSALALPLVGLTLNKLQADPAAMQLLISSFAPLKPEWQRELECPDYKEKSGLENFFDRLRKDRSPEDKQDKPVRKKKGFFRRLIR